MKDDKDTCNQCDKQMNGNLLVDQQFIRFCENPNCPNYALLQIALEDMPTPKGEQLDKLTKEE